MPKTIELTDHAFARIKTIEINEIAYERLKSNRGADESWSEVIERLVPPKRTANDLLKPTTSSKR